ncbi:hydrogenase formation protein HypD [Patescibacteria group bacterium]|nr:hydrogenase formation protein HypD [Patescibacteria group bacterium]MBU4580223.1 hydrogenase formation protein HypD [Patescibacteria group bacterium]
MKNIIKQINTLAQKIDRQVVLMELCGTHTEAVARHGIKKLLPKNIKLLSGPGCPVCVTDQRDIDAVITLALEGIPIACYGDVLRVPGAMKISNIQYPISNISLDKAREMGADVNEVYSTEDALELQKKKPNLVFFGLGFETTAPMTASAIKRGLTVYSSHKAFAPAMAALLDTPQLKVDGFINPGHVSAIIGVEPYKKLLQPTTYNLQPRKLPQVIAGFDANDVIITIYMLLKQIAENRAEVENQYVRVVRPEGNPKAMKLINEVFEIKDAYWRGIGKIPNSGFEIRPKYSRFDAKVKYENIIERLGSKASKSYLDALLPSNSGCICGAILRGLKEPQDCKLFRKTCTPENPIGACMVSSEGACGIEARYKENQNGK